MRKQCYCNKQQEEITEVVTLWPQFIYSFASAQMKPQVLEFIELTIHINIVIATGFIVNIIHVFKFHFASLKIIVCAKFIFEKAR